jgi:hypothetical protein
MQMTSQPDQQTPTVQADAAAPELDPQSLAAIRSLLASQSEGAEESATPAPAVVVATPPASATPTAAPRRATGKAALPPLSAPDPVAAPRPTSRLRATIGNWVTQQKARVLGYRPTPQHIMWACFGLLVLFRPWLIIGMLLLGLFVFLGVFLVLGYDGFWHRTMALGRWYARRRPEHSARLHSKLDTFAMKWDAVLDRFPEGTVDGLYLPDFGELAAAEARHDASLDRRFDTLRETEG